MSELKLDTNTFEQVLRNMNLKAVFHSTVTNKAAQETDDAELGKWLREYIETHNQEAVLGEKPIWD